MKNDFELATLAAGCFWCTEAIFSRLKGVESVRSGYAGGTVDQPSYEEVSSGETGHAEAIQIKFDPKQISYEKILEIFWATHNPTTPNQQGHDVGPQYRSVIFYHNPEQKNIAEKSLKNAQESGDWKEKIVTEIAPFANFFEAEDYHQQYFEKNKEAPYCQVVIMPKLQKLLKMYQKEVKEKYQEAS